MTELSSIIPSDEDLNKWEGLRQSGKLDLVVSETRDVVDFRFDQSFNTLSSAERTRAVKKGRLFVDSVKSLAAQAPDAKVAFTNLNSAKTGIENVYRDPRVEKFLRDENPDLYANTLRDTAKYLLTAFHLTSDTSFLNTAVEVLNEAGEFALGVSDRTLVNYEVSRLQYKANDEVDFNTLRGAYENAYGSATSLKMWERASSVAAFHAVDAIVFKKPIAFVSALIDFGKVMPHDRSNIRALPAQIYKHFTEKKRHANWQKTKDPRIDYTKELQIR